MRKDSVELWGKLKVRDHCKTGWNRQGTFFSLQLYCPGLQIPSSPQLLCLISAHRVSQKFLCSITPKDLNVAFCPHKVVHQLFQREEDVQILTPSLHSTAQSWHLEKPCPFSGTQTSLFTFPRNRDCCRPMICLLWDLVTKTSDSIHCNEIQLGWGQTRCLGESNPLLLLLISLNILDITGNLSPLLL